MTMTGEENPFYEHFDEILDICEQHDVTISLGDACRPAAWPTPPTCARLKSWCVWAS